MTDQQHVKDEPNAKSEPSSRPWIISLAYWNGVAKDVVKAACIAFVIYLGGVIAGIFKLHLEVVIGVVAALIAILIWTIKPFLDERFAVANHILMPVTALAAAVFFALIFRPLPPLSSSSSSFSSSWLAGNAWIILGLTLGFVIAGTLISWAIYKWNQKRK